MISELWQKILIFLSRNIAWEMVKPNLQTSCWVLCITYFEKNSVVFRENDFSLYRKVFSQFDWISHHQIRPQLVVNFPNIQKLIYYCFLIQLLIIPSLAVNLWKLLIMRVQILWNTYSNMFWLFIIFARICICFLRFTVCASQFFCVFSSLAHTQCK